LAPADKYVLIVEDDKDIRDSLAQLLEDYGYEARVASNGREALDLLAEAPAPKLILLDLMMPVMDGSEFSKAASSRPQLASVPICLVTASARLPEGLPGVVAVLRKPMDPLALIDIVQRHCDG
jgi:CheY-like chemotaxis protein